MTDVAAWRGVAAEDGDDVEATEGAVGVRLRQRSRALLGDLLRPHRSAVGWAVLLLLVQNGALLAEPYLISVAIDHGLPPLIRHGDGGPLLLVVAAIVLSAACGYAARRSYLVVSTRVGQALLLDLRQRVFEHLQRLSLAFHERYTSGRVITRMTSDVDALAELVDGGLDDLVIQALNVGVIAVILVALDWRLGLLALCSFPVLAVLGRWFQRRSAIAYRRTREASALVIVHFVESLGGIRAVQAFRRESRNDALFRSLSGASGTANRKAMRLVAVFAPAVEIVGNITVALVLGVGGALAVRGEIAIGVLTAVLLYLRRFFDPMQELTMFYNSLQSATAALEKLSGVLEEEPDVAPPAHPVALPHAAGAVDLHGVRFGYRADRPVLHTLDLHIPAGQTVALLGATGAGKTTIARLVGRFYDPDAGSVELDGVDLRALATDDLHRAVVTVTQENILFSGSVADNIAFGRPGASRAAIEAAAAEVGADRAMGGMDQGFDTPVGPHGARLSAGQRQLVAFARAVLADPAVLILDEATSSLDVPSEHAVQRALTTILAGRTALIIAHRLSTVEIADRVLVLDEGRIVEDGTPGELIAAGGRFATLHQQWQDSLT